MIYENDYGKYSVPDDNTSAANMIRAGKVYEPETIRFMVKSMGSGSVVQSGAYFGDFLPALGKACKGNVYSFEPNTNNWVHASKTIEINKLDNVTVDNVALSDKDGEVTIRIAKNKISIGGGSHVIDGDKEGYDYQKIKTVKLDDVIKDNISIIQLDVEGHEEQALRGGLKTIEKCKPILIVENKPTDEFFIKYLQPLGYRYNNRKLHMNFIIHTSEHNLRFR